MAFGAEQIIRHFPKAPALLIEKGQVTQIEEFKTGGLTVRTGNLYRIIGVPPECESYDHLRIHLAAWVPDIARGRSRFLRWLRHFGTLSIGVPAFQVALLGKNPAGAVIAATTITVLAGGALWRLWDLSEPAARKRSILLAVLAVALVGWCWIKITVVGFATE